MVTKAQLLAYLTETMQLYRVQKKTKMTRKYLSFPDRTRLHFSPYESNANFVQTRCYCRPWKLLVSFPRLVYTV